MNRINMMVLLLFICQLSSRPLAACTIFYACDGNLCLGGNNEDWSDPNTFMWFKPAAPREFGRVYFGFANGWPQGGMNDQGLFFDGAATEPNPIATTKAKNPFRADLLDLVMRTCATVDEALDLLEQYEIPFMVHAMLLFGDRYGHSAIYEGDDILHRPDDTRHHVLTNYYQSRLSAAESNCRRHYAAEKIFTDKFGHDKQLTIDLMKSVLDATHQEGKFPTMYSNVYDLTNGIIHLYHNHNFDKAVTINLADELTKGGHRVELAALFESHSDAVAWRWNKPSTLVLLCIGSLGLLLLVWQERRWRLALRSVQITKDTP